eukprot:scaffold47039_cov54-Phaeocystis_antarctica.AAC.2
MSRLLESDTEFASCRIKGRAGHTVRGEARAREARGRVGTGTAQVACTGRARLEAGGQGTRRAHVEHPAHVRDAGRVEAQRLVEHRRGLPRVGRRAYDAGQGAGREVEGRGAVAAQAACTGRV